MNVNTMRILSAIFVVFCVGWVIYMGLEGKWYLSVMTAVPCGFMLRSWIKYEIENYKINH
jgi:hypothetical protein